MKKTFTCTLVVLLLMALPTWANTILINSGTSWKYLDNGSNQGTAWRSPSFNDSAWPSGNAQLGYGDGDEATVVNSGPSSNKYITTYFRKSFSISNASSFVSYLLQVKRDDGVVVYVNGTEVWRSNMPSGTIAYNTYASATASDDGGTFQNVTLGTSAFITGTNVIAVEIHQANATSSDISFDLQLTGNVSSSVNEVIYMWSGAIQPTSAVVVAKMTNASTTCRLVVSTSSSLSNPVLSPAATASSSNNNMAKMTIAGLTPNTTYYYAVQSNGVTDNSSDDIGSFKTPVNGAFSYRFTVGSCAVSSNHQVYVAMQNKAPLFHLSTGDFHYVNPNSSTDINVHRLPYEQHMLSQTPTRNFFKQTGLAFMWDDHDYSGNNSNGSSAGRTNARLAYQEYVPHYPLAAGSGNVGIYQTFKIGRVYFILSDLRSERTSTNIMSSTQKTWFKNQCLYARDNNLIIAWITGVSFGGNQSDNWGGFNAERVELSNFFRDNNIRNMFILSGDAHMLAIDNGANHDFSTGSNNPYDYPVFQAAAVNNSGSTKGGIYSEGGTFPNPSSSTGQYGVVDITDTGGSSITVKFTGYRTSGNTTTESVLTSYTFSRNLTTTTSTRTMSARSINEGNDVQLSWDNPAEETSVTIEKSTDGVQYFPLVNGINGMTTYTDTNPETGWNYYRYAIAKGKVETKKIYITKKVDMSIAPNPAKTTATVKLENVKQVTKARYMLYNIKMKTELQGEISLDEGSSSFTINTTELPEGEYFLHVVLHGNELVKKLIVLK